MNNRLGNAKSIGLQAENATSAFSALDREYNDEGDTESDGDTDTCRYKL